MNFDDLRRHAEQHLGKDLVDRAETVVRQKMDRDSKEAHVVHVEDVQFNQDIAVLAAEAQRRLGLQERSILPMAQEKRQVPATDQHKYADPEGASTVAKTNSDQVLLSPQGQNQKSSHSAELLRSVIEREYLYGMLGLGLGLCCIISGVILGLNGVAGATSWTASVLGLESRINDAAPGVVIFIVGVFMIWITKPKVSIKNLKG